jgi:uncharacterized membrane protein (DUF2068 family)
MKSANNRLIRLIALFKLLKAALLIAVALSALHLLHKDLGEVVDHWVTKFNIDPGKRYIAEALEKFVNLTPQKIKALGIVSFLYAGLFLIEGIGLWMVKRWAEWFSVILTTSLIPLEVYGIYHHRSAMKCLILIVNIAVVVYLLHRMRNEGSV